MLRLPVRWVGVNHAVDVGLRLPEDACEAEHDVPARLDADLDGREELIGLFPVPFHLPL